MPVYEYICAKGHTFEIRCRLAEWTDIRPCNQEGCAEIAEQFISPSGSDNEVPPIVIHVDSEGHVRFPGASDARVPEGFEKRELRTIRQIEAFERDMNCRLRSEARQHQENEERYFSQVRSQLRGELRQRMQQMSEAGKSFARLAMALNDQRRSKSTETGFHVEILHFDQSNREAHRDERTGWKPRHR